MHAQNPTTIPFARRLRAHSTEAERALWYHLRGNRFGMKFRRQHPFLGYVLDFVALDARLVIELDGGQHAERTEHDERRSALLRDAGFEVLRFWNHEVFQEQEAVLERIRGVVVERMAELNRSEARR